MTPSSQHKSSPASSQCNTPLSDLSNSNGTNIEFMAYNNDSKNSPPINKLSLAPINSTKEYDEPMTITPGNNTNNTNDDTEDEYPSIAHSTTSTVLRHLSDGEDDVDEEDNPQSPVTIHIHESHEHDKQPLDPDDDEEEEEEAEAADMNDFDIDAHNHYNSPNVHQPGSVVGGLLGDDMDDMDMHSTTDIETDIDFDDILTADENDLDNIPQTTINDNVTTSTMPEPTETVNVIIPGGETDDHCIPNMSTHLSAKQTSAYSMQSITKSKSKSPPSINTSLNNILPSNLSPPGTQKEGDSDLPDTPDTPPTPSTPNSSSLDSNNSHFDRVMMQDAALDKFKSEKEDEQQNAKSSFQLAITDSNTVANSTNIVSIQSHHSEHTPEPNENIKGCNGCQPCIIL
eukprot:114706_1